jgi:chromate transporter
MNGRTWIELALQLLVLSVMQVGGALAIAPDLHRLMVERMALVTDAQFAASIAIAQASPGPNTLYVAIAGYQAAGLAGALLAQAAVLGPCSALALAVARWGRAKQDWRGLLAFKAGMAPISIALLCAASWIIVSDAPGWRHVLLAAAAALLVWRTRIHILWMIAGGALAGALGWV